MLGGETKPTISDRNAREDTAAATAPARALGEGLIEFELSVRIGGEIPVADLLVLQSQNPRMYRDVLDEPPLLCVEVVSPSASALGNITYTPSHAK